MRIALALIIAAPLVGCAGATHVVSTGPGTYMVASHGTMGWSSGPAQKAKAFEEANDYCKKLGREMQPINSSETESGFGKIASGEVDFRCVANDQYRKIN